MRRGRRIDEKDNFKTWLYVLGSILGILIIAFALTFSIYTSKGKKNINLSNLNTTKVAELVPSLTDMGDSEAASLEIGKTVNEMISNESNTIENTNTQSNVEQNTKSTTTETKAEAKKAPEPERREMSFGKPVEGEVIAEFAKDNLIYSKTLKEWITHNGIDIKANKDAIVKAAEEGRIKSIKNDPRYGLTIIIEHEDGYKTIYSNLLSAEFVVEGEKVEKDKTIGTVGDSAIFESAEEFHLHFELLKNDEYLNPMNYFK